MKRSTLLLLSLWACGDDDSMGRDAALMDANAADTVEDGTVEDGTVEDGTVADDTSPGQPPSEVPAVRLAGDSDACPGAYARQAPTNGLNENFASAGQSREFHLILPPDSFTGPRPLFIAFNGTGEDGPNFARRAGLSDFAERGFIVAAPSSNMNGRIWPIWDDMRRSDDHDRENMDITFVDEMLGCLAGHFEVDENRIFAGGHSAGGIFTNAFVQRRSDLLAGAIAASGIIDLTTPPLNPALDPIFVIVTWGGPNDEYSGGVGITVPSINFVEQAGRASRFYENEPNVGQMNCNAPSGIGHAWLPINSFFIDRLLEHPKGIATGNLDSLPDTGDPRIVCSAEPPDAPPPMVIMCPPSTFEPGCQRACQSMATCGAANMTIRDTIGPQLTMLGFTGTHFDDCSGCVSACEAQSLSTVDYEILDCIDTATDTGAMCGPGISGFTPWSDAVSMCCDGRSDSNYCVQTCRVLLTNGVAPMFFPGCVGL